MIDKINNADRARDETIEIQGPEQKIKAPTF
jgi:hypothetical protein